MLPSHVVHNHNIALSWPTTQPKMAVMIIFVEYESTVYMAFVTKVFVKVTLSFLLCSYLQQNMPQPMALSLPSHKHVRMIVLLGAIYM